MVFTTPIYRYGRIVKARLVKSFIRKGMILQVKREVYKLPSWPSCDGSVQEDELQNHLSGWMDIDDSNSEEVAEAHQWLNRKGYDDIRIQQ